MKAIHPKVIKGISVCAMLHLVVCSWVLASERYSITDLGGRHVEAINNNGQVLGWYVDEHDNIMSIYDNGFWTDTGSIGFWGRPRDINDSGQVVGSWGSLSDNKSAFLFTDGMFYDIGKLGGMVSDAYKINNQSQIIVNVYYGDNRKTAFIYWKGNVIELEGSRVAFGINDSGDVVGDFILGAFLYRNGEMKQIGSFPDTSPYYYNSARDINDLGTVVGVWATGAGYQLFLWDGENTIDLGLLYGIDVNPGTETAINNLNQVVSYEHVMGSSRAILWENGKIYDLNDLIPQDTGWVLKTAGDINDSGVIIGWGIFNGSGHAYLLTPVKDKSVNIDIKPGSYPNSINLKSRGVVPVAILTTYCFDVSLVDPDTVTFAGAEPVRWNLEDIDGDGYIDMVLHFNTQDLMLDSDSTEATLTGMTLDGANIEGTDSVNIVPKGKGKK